MLIIVKLLKTIVNSKNKKYMILFYEFFSDIRYFYEINKDFDDLLLIFKYFQFFC